MLDPGDRAEPLATVRAEDTELTVRRCVFRRPADLSARGAALAALSLRATLADDGERSPAVTVDKCHFDGGQAGIRATGPVELLLRDCTLGGLEPAVWLDNGRAASPVAAEVWLRHVSILAAEGPVFRFEGTEPRVWVDDSVVAPSRDREATLVASDLPDSLAWRGRGNLYCRVATFLLPTDGGESIRDALHWSEANDEVRETGTVIANQPVWDEIDPSKVLAQESRNPTRAFRLAATHEGAADVGARQGPFGTLAPAARLVASTAHDAPARVTKPPDERRGPERTPETSDTGRVSPPPANPATAPTAPAATTHSDTPAKSEEPASPGAASKMNDLPEMPVMPPTGAAREKEKGVSTDPAENTPETPPVVKPAPAEPAASAVIRTADQLLNAVTAPGSRGGLLRVAADADMEFSTAVIKAAGAWRIQAEPGPTRPKLRFLPAADAKMPTAWTAMIELRSGSLQLEGFDVVLPRANAPRQGRWVAFAVWPSTDLSLTACTVTVEGDQVVSAVVAVEAGDTEVDEGLNAPELAAATVRINDSLARTGGDLVDVTAGRRLVLEMDNDVVATEGSLVHAHGLPRGQVAERLSVTLRQVTARVAGGLVALESATGEPELPVADISARYTILATTTKDAPLIRVDGQDSPASMRDRVVWEGLGVCYHQISTYRRDQSSQLSAVPTSYDRSSWIVAVGSREQAAVHGDMKFRREWDPTRHAWTLVRDDVRLAKDSPARASGSDLDRIPDPPGS
jgi:eukaryotic-like serine/threonine-protein kinase